MSALTPGVPVFVLRGDGSVSWTGVVARVSDAAVTVGRRGEGRAFLGFHNYPHDSIRRVTR